MTETTQWIDPYGAATTLDVEWDRKGLFSPKAVFTEETTPGRSGARLRFVRHEVREFAMTINVSGTTEANLRTQVRSLVAAMNPLRGDGAIRITSPLGDQREIPCRLVDGLGLDEKLGDKSGLFSEKPTLVFRAVGPYWRAVSDIAGGPWNTGVTATFFPVGGVQMFRLTSSTIAADINVSNDGDLEAQPVWTITGPGSVIVLRNLTTGKSLTLSGVTLGSGETVIIDTRDDLWSVKKGDGTNLFSTMPASSSLWTLALGTNQVRLEMSGATSASSLKLAYRTRYLTA